jgi:ATP-dependent RNA helicase RhlE
MRKIMQQEKLKNAILFCNRKRDVDVVAKSMKRHGINAEPIHGDLNQSIRTETLARFKSDDIQILVASDVAARGLDIPDVSHVLNYDVPFHAEDYVHRIGRTGRAGRKGTAITLATPIDQKALAAIVEMLNKPIPIYEMDGSESRTSSKPEAKVKPAQKPRNTAKSAPSKARGTREKPKQKTDSKTGFGQHVPAFFATDE